MSKSFIAKYGWPRIIIGLFLISLFIVGAFIELDIVRSVVDVLNRFGMNALLVLAMIPMIQSGCGLNFGLPVGIIGGMLGAVISVELHMTGVVGAIVAIIFGMFFGALFGWGYSQILNRVKGDEMIIATYVGFSFVALMNMMWIYLPFKNPNSVMGFKGEGLRTTIALKEYWDKAISKILGFEIKPSVFVPVGMFIIFALFAFMVWAYFRSKNGSAMTAVGSNPNYARAAGINVNRHRIVSVMLSSAIAAAGIILYQQSFGFIQMYNTPLSFAFPSVAAILLGGASISKSNILNVLIGALLFQGILTMTPQVINTLIKIDISEVLRLIISNGMIVYALTRKGGDN